MLLLYARFTYTIVLRYSSVYHSWSAAVRVQQRSNPFVLRASNRKQLPGHRSVYQHGNDYGLQRAATAIPTYFPHHQCRYGSLSFLLLEFVNLRDIKMNFNSVQNSLFRYVKCCFGF